MILDPSRDGCNIWHNKMVTCLRGDINEICREIYKRVTAVVDIDLDGNPIVEQLCDIGIDIGAIGITYKDILTSIGIRTYDIRGKNKDIVIPIRNERMVGINKDYCKQEHYIDYKLKF